LKRIHLVSLAFVVVGVAIQVAASVNGDNAVLKGGAAALLIFGVVIEIIGYAIGDDGKKNHDPKSIKTKNI
jgi:hypothetical protein